MWEYIDCAMMVAQLKAKFCYIVNLALFFLNSLHYFLHSTCSIGFGETLTFVRISIKNLLKSNTLIRTKNQTATKCKI